MAYNIVIIIIIIILPIAYRLFSPSGVAAVRAASHGAAAAVLAAVPVLQRPAADPCAVPHARRLLLQQPVQPPHPRAGAQRSVVVQLHRGEHL